MTYVGYSAGQGQSIHHKTYRNWRTRWPIACQILPLPSQGGVQPGGAAEIPFQFGGCIRPAARSTSPDEETGSESTSELTPVSAKGGSEAEAGLLEPGGVTASGKEGPFGGTSPPQAANLSGQTHNRYRPWNRSLLDLMRALGAHRMSTRTAGEIGNPGKAYPSTNG